MQLEKMVELLEGVAPSYVHTLEPVHKRIILPFQSSFKGFYPSASTRKALMGRFYEGLTRALYGGRLNDLKFDIEFLNGTVSDRSIKPDVVDAENNLDWESKSGYYDKECKIMSRQFEGYKFLQYDNPGKRYLFSFYRHSLEEIEKKERTEKQVFIGLLDGTLYSATLPFSVVLKIDNLLNVGARKIARKYRQREGTSYPDCLCINPSTFNCLFSLGFITSPGLIIMPINP
ncbi:MAG: hypothetical protein AABX50_02200 [Nanoarchaeota archaeon]